MDIRADPGRVRTQQLVLVVASVLVLPLIVVFLLDLLRIDRQGGTHGHGNAGDNDGDV